MRRRLDFFTGNLTFPTQKSNSDEFMGFSYRESNGKKPNLRPLQTYLAEQARVNDERNDNRAVHAEFS